MNTTLKAILSFICITVTFPAFASSEDDCDQWQIKADHFMNLRQEGIPITQAMKNIYGNQTKGLLLRAYSRPIENSFSAKTAAVESFKKMISDECLNSETDK